VNAFTVIAAVLAYVLGGYIYSRHLINALVEHARKLGRGERSYMYVVWHSTIIYILIWPLRALTAFIYGTLIVVAEFVLRNIFRLTNYRGFKDSEH
jgi:hypothetical protein